MKYEVYQVKRGKFAGQWRWRLKAANGRIIANSGESYRNRLDCLKAIDLVMASNAAEII